MKNVKDVFNTYEEKPSADLWERLNARLDKEMPVTGNVSRLHRVKVWKWVAAALTVLVLGGAVSLGVFLQHRNNQDVIAEKIVENTDKETVVSPEAVREQDEIVKSDVVLSDVKEDKRPNPSKLIMNWCKNRVSRLLRKNRSRKQISVRWCYRPIQPWPSNSLPILF